MHVSGNRGTNRGREFPSIESAVESARNAGARVGRRTDSDDDRLGGNRKPRVSIVIPVFNQAEMTEKCLFAIAENSGDDPDYGVIVVDNGSTDWTMYLLHAMEGDLQVLNNDHNEGFARACNKGGGAGGTGDYLLFLNNDTIPRPGWLRALVELADSAADIGVVGAKLVYPDSGKIQHAGIVLNDGIPDHVNRGVDGDDRRVNEVREFDMVTGACLLIRKTLFEDLGGFDTEFVNGVEDVDLCLRARDLGFRVVYCPDSIVEHHEGVSDGRFDNVAGNLARFRERWGSRFDAQGRFVVRSANGESAPASGNERSPQRQQSTVNWEGSFLLHSSLAYVNREMALALLASEECDLGLQSFEPDEFGVEEDPRFWPLAQRMDRPYPKADFHVKHRWPPDFTRPYDESRFILMQPWEFGRLPASWMEPLGNVDEVWAYTSCVKQCYVDSGIDPDMVTIVPLGVDPARFRPEAEPFKYDTDKRFKFLFVGGTLYRKGIDLLLRAYCEAFDPAEDVCLVIKDMGANSFYRNQNARERIEQLQADPDCADIVYRSDNLRGIEIPGLYTAADALVHPYRGEGFGLPVAEAMACGLPVIVTQGGATDDFCPPELVYGIPAQRKPIHFEEQTAGEAWLLEPDIEALKQSMRTVFENGSEATARGLRASEHIRSQFTWERAGAAALEALENRALGNRAVEDHLPPPRALPAEVHGDAEDGFPGSVQLFADFRGQVAENAGEVESSNGQEAPQESSASPDQQVASPLDQRAGTATIFLKIGETGGSDHGRLVHLPAPVDAFELKVEPQYPLGSQLELVRTSSENREFIAILGPQLPSAEQIGQLASRLSANPRLGLVAASSHEIEGSSFYYPDSSRGLLLRAEALAATGGFDESFSGLAVIANLTRCLRSQGWEIDLGEQSARGTHADAESCAVSYLEEGDRLRRAGSLKESLLAYRRAVHAKPDLVEALLVLTDCLMDAGELPDAIDTIEHLVRLDPESSWSHNYAGLVHFKGDNADVARGHFRRALDLQPELVEARVNLAVLEWECEDFGAALRELGEASRVDPSNRDLVCNISLIYTQIGQWEAAVTVLEDYLRLRPDDVEVLSQLADVQAVHGSAEDAQRTAERILRIDSANARAAQIIEQCGGWEEEEEKKKHPPLA